MSKMNKNEFLRKRRHKRGRFNLAGTGERPRMAVFRSLQHIYVQVIDDDKGNTLCAASTMEKDLRDQKVDGGNKGGAKKVGTLVAERALAKGITKVVFDKGGFKYHGRVKELADGARAAGLKF